MVCDLSSSFIFRLAVGGCDLLAPPNAKKKADVAEHLGVFDHVGLLVNEPPGTAGLPFI
jgi:hypothetical protein